MADDSTRTTRHEQAMRRFAFVAEAEASQREREVEQIKFTDFDDQWPEDVKAARSGLSSSPSDGSPPVPARPCLVINKLRVPLEQVSNECRSARLALQMAPKRGGASRAQAEAMEDIARAIQAESRAALARQWAFDRAAKCGRGYYRLLTEYTHDGDFDQDIVYKRILNQSSVYLDPGATEPDWSDGRWAFIVSDLPWDRYTEEFPDSELAVSGADDAGTLTGVGDDQPGWVSDTPDGGKVVRVAEYFYLTDEPTEVGLWAFPDGSERTLPLEPAPVGAQLVVDERGLPMVRTVKTRTVHWCKLNAIEILEEGILPGTYIPIIPVIASESNANGERRWVGMVGPAMDAQRSYNYMVSAEAETIGLAPRAPYVGYYETIEPYIAWWSQANQRNFPVLPIAAVRGPDGTVLPPPTRSVTEPAIQAIVIAKQGADGDIKATTGRWDASLGNLGPSERSGKAILALQKQAEQGSSSGWLDNLAQMSMMLEGKILREWIPLVYSRPGRVVASIGRDEQPTSVMIGKPFVAQDGYPQEVPPDTPGAQLIDLKDAQMAVAVTVGKSFTTRREEATAAMGQLAEAAPQLVPIYADVWVDQMDFPGAKVISERLKTQLPPNVAAGDEQPVPPAIQRKLDEQGQMLELLQKELNAKNDLIEKDTLKLEADLKKTEADNAAKIQVASIQSQTQIAIEQMKLEAAAVGAEVEREKADLAYLQAFNAQQMQLAADAEGREREFEAQSAMSAQQTGEQALLAEQQAALAPPEVEEAE
jgi:Phage P22-like portal protein